MYFLKNKSGFDNYLDILKKSLIILIIVLIIISDLSFINNPIIYYDKIRVIDPFLNNCDIHHLPQLRDPFRYYTLCLSDQLLGNPRIIPIISTVVLIGFVLIYTRKLIDSNMAILLSAFILVSTKSFLYYGFTATYDQIWVTLFFSSLLLLNTKYRYLSIIPFIISLGFRGLPLLDIPIIITQIIILDIPKKSKIILTAIFVLVSILAVIYTLNGGIALTQGQELRFDLKAGFDGISSFRMDYFFYLTLPIEIYVLLKIKTKQVGFIIFSICYLAFQVYMLNAFTNLGQEPYRLFPLIIFMAIGYGKIFKKYGVLKNESK